MLAEPVSHSRHRFFKFWTTSIEFSFTSSIFLNLILSSLKVSLFKSLRDLYIFKKFWDTMIFKGQFSLGVDKYTFFVWLYKQWTFRHSNNCFIWTCKGIFGACLMQADFNGILKLEMNVPEVVVISFYSKLVQLIMLLLFVKLTFKSVFVDFVAVMWTAVQILFFCVGHVSLPDMSTARLNCVRMHNGSDWYRFNVWHYMEFCLLEQLVFVKQERKNYTESGERYSIESWLVILR